MNVVHKKAGSTHIIGIGNLRVLVREDGGHWFAQGLEIDYAAEGDSFEDAHKRFTDGLRLTIIEHIRRFRSIEHLLEAAPPDVWRRIALDVAVKRLKVSCVATYDLAKDVKDDLPDGFVFPYKQVEFLRAA